MVRVLRRRRREQTSTIALFVLENASDDPFKGTFCPEREDLDPLGRPLGDRTALCSASRNRTYFVWSGWEGTRDEAQDLYIGADGRNPWTLAGPRVLISRPTPGLGSSVEAHPR